jgi:hypothetical protein
MQLLYLFTVAGEAGDSFNTPWVPFPQDYDRAELWVECKMFTGSTVDIKLQTSMDTDDTKNATGATISEITTKLAAFARLNVAISTGTTHGVISVWVLPKRE